MISGTIAIKGNSQNGISIGIAIFLIEELKDSIEIIENIKYIVIIVLNKDMNGENILIEETIACIIIAIKGPAIKYTLFLGVRIANNPARENIAPEAPTANIVGFENILPPKHAPKNSKKQMFPKKNESKAKNNPANKPEIIYSQKNLFLPIILSIKLPIKNNENIFTNKCRYPPCINMLVNRVHTFPKKNEAGCKATYENRLSAVFCPYNFNIIQNVKE